MYGLGGPLYVEGRRRNGARGVTRVGASSAAPLPKAARNQQSCVGASTDHHRNAPGHRGRLGSHRLRDHAPPAPARNTAHSVPVVGATARRHHRDADRAGPGAGSAGTDRPPASPHAGRVLTGAEARRHVGPRRRIRAHGTGCPPGTTRPTTAPRPAAEVAAPCRDPPDSGDDPDGSPEERRRVRPRPQVRRLGQGHSPGGHLQGRLRPVRGRRPYGRCLGGPGVSPPVAGLSSSRRDSNRARATRMPSP
ncbi:hypothetical protein SMA5143A_5444 [Streptomyces sp. MA5143a]|nr:hypothetical protein SMA5143A_5444 [Streptomyces sp. MA5143a]